MKKYKIKEKKIINHLGLSAHHYAMIIVYFLINIIARNIFPIYLSGNTSLLLTVLMFVAFTIIILLQTKDKAGNKIYTNAILEYMKVAKKTIVFAFITAGVILVLLFGMYYQNYFFGTSPIYIYLNISYKHIDIILSFILNILNSFLLVTIFYEILYRNSTLFKCVVGKRQRKKNYKELFKNTIFATLISLWVCYICGYIVANVTVSLLPTLTYFMVFTILNNIFIKTENTIYIVMIYIFSNIAIFYVI